MQGLVIKTYICNYVAESGDSVQEVVDSNLFIYKWYDFMGDVCGCTCMCVCVCACVDISIGTGHNLIM